MEKMLELSSGAPVPRGVTFFICVTTQEQFVPKRLLVTEEVAAAFVLEEVYGGVEPLLLTQSKVSMALFVKDSATASQLRAIVMEQGMDFSLRITNISDAPCAFACDVLGERWRSKPRKRG